MICYGSTISKFYKLVGELDFRLIISYYISTCKMFSSTIWSHKTTNYPTPTSETSQNLPPALDNTTWPTPSSFKWDRSPQIKLNSLLLRNPRSKRKEKNQKISSSMKRISQKVPTALNTIKPTEASSRNMAPIQRIKRTNRHNNYNNWTSGTRRTWRKSPKRKSYPPRRPSPPMKSLYPQTSTLSSGNQSL